MTSAGGDPAVEVTAALESAVYQPGAGEPASVAGDRARKDRRRLAAAYRQLASSEVRAALLTSLRQAPGAEPTQLPAVTADRPAVRLSRLVSPLPA